MAGELDSSAAWVDEMSVARLSKSLGVVWRALKRVDRMAKLFETRRDLDLQFLCQTLKAE